MSGSPESRRGAVEPAHDQTVTSATRRAATSSVRELGSGDLQTQYRLLAKLGEGGMAVVHLAVARGIGGVRKLLVLKTVRPELVANPFARSMFLAEARLAPMLNHPNVVQTHEILVIQGRPVIVMEYLEGQPFSRIIGRTSGPEALSLRLHVLRETLAGLEYVHRFVDLDGTPLNLVHRDISPQNIFVTYEGQVKILDFGIAKVVGARSNTETGELRGKVRYMAPEQMLNSSELDRRADLFSVGVMLWEAATGRRVWDGMADVPVIQAVVSSGVPAPISVNPEVPEALDAICRKALAQKPADRYESASAMIADLEEAISALGRSVSTRRVGKIVSETFAEVRSAVRAAVEGQLKDEAAAPVNLLVSADHEHLAIADVDGEHDPWGPPSAPSKATTKRIVRARAVPVVPALVLGAVLLGVVVIGVRGRLPSNGRRAEAPPASFNTQVGAAPPTSSTPNLRPTVVHVSIAAEPPAARLFLDDAPLPTNPYVSEQPYDSSLHAIRVEAAGYRPETLRVAFEQPIDEHVSLEPLLPVAAERAGVSPAKSATVIRRPVPAAASATVRAQPTPCSAPYYLDESGIKRVRPECLK